MRLSTARDELRAIRTRFAASGIVPLDTQRRIRELYEIVCPNRLKRKLNNRSIRAAVIGHQAGVPTSRGTEGFGFRLCDGSTEFISFTKTDDDPTVAPEHEQFADACRWAIADEMRQFKADWLAAQPRTITNTAAYHVDHHPTPFIDIVVEFRKQLEAIDEYPPKFMFVPEPVSHFEFADPDIAEAFRFVHTDRPSNLRVISAAENLKQGAKHRSTMRGALKFANE